MHMLTLFKTMFENIFLINSAINKLKINLMPTIINHKKYLIKSFLDESFLIIHLHSLRLFFLHNFFQMF